MKHIRSNNTKSELTNVRDIDIQPNAVDIRIDKVFKINRRPFILDEETKTHRGSVQILPDINDVWRLEPGVYEFVAENSVKIAEGEAGYLRVRSTLNRNGVYITSGLFDSGYDGVIAGVLHVTLDSFHVTKGTRIGQFVLHDAETLKLYDGDYGNNKPHDEKYK